MLRRGIKVPLLCSGCLLLGGLIGWFLPFESPLSAQAIESYRGATIRQSSINYQFISPLLACDVGSEEAFPELNPLKKELTAIINQEESVGNAENISVYFRLMKGSRWFEINGGQTYAPASLLKIFVMMAYYKEADETANPGMLQQEIPFEASAFADDGTDAVGGTIVHLVNGKLYTVDQIINQMIIYSDNDAYATLLDHFDPNTVSSLAAISTDLQIPLPITHTESSLAFMSVDDYSVVFRVLFGSTYLSENYSEKALGLLSQAKYRTGIVAGVPSNFTVAHKYGIMATVAASATNPEYLHDCGVVYFPNHPYLLCIMTKGQNLVTQQTSIKNISAATYAWLVTYYKNLASSGNATSTPPVVTP